MCANILCEAIECTLYMRESSYRVNDADKSHDFPLTSYGFEFQKHGLSNALQFFFFKNISYLLLALRPVKFLVRFRPFDWIQNTGVNKSE